MKSTTSRKIMSAVDKEKVQKERRSEERLAKEQTFQTQIEDVLTKVFSKWPGQAQRPFTPKKRGVVKRELNLLISDTHFGSDLDPRYVPHRYGVVEEARRLAYVTKQVAEYKRQYRDETKLRIHLAGDIIQNQLHDKRDGDISAAQVARAIWLLNQMIHVLALEFPAGIEVDATTGNHGRNTGRHIQRATYEKVDSLETMIYFAIKTSTQYLKNVTFNIPRTPYISYDSFGAKCFGTHGDTVLNPGNPGASVNVKSLETQINRINASVPDVNEYKLFFVGHVHVGMMLHMNNGATLITNGALIPNDQFSTSIGLFENQCGQWMWESVPDHVVGDSRFISVTPSVDTDPTLDKIILPFRDF